MHRSWTDDCARRIVIVVPCYNEEKRLPIDTFRRFAARNSHVKFLMVNDGSRDGTARTLGDLEKQRPHSFEFLDLPTNRGKAEAIRHGFLHAIESGPEMIGYWDADLSAPLESICEFESVLRRLPEIDLVIAARLSLRGRKILRRPLRSFLGRVFVTVASIVLGIRIRDTQCGAKLFRMTPDLVAVFSNPFLAKWVFDVEVIARMRQLRKQAGRSRSEDFLFEAPLDRWEEIGSSRLKSHDFFTAILDLARIYWRHVRPGASPYEANPSVATQLAATAEVSEVSRRAA